MSKRLMVGAGLGLILSAVVAQAAPITTPPQVLSAIGDVTAVYVFADAGDTSILNELTPVAINQIFCNHSTGSCTGANPGDTAPLGFQTGIMTFSLHNVTSGTTFFSDLPDSDGNYHVKISDDYADFGQGALPAAANTVIGGLISSGMSVTYVGWEDWTAGQGSDFDYNDLIFAFANTTTRNVPEPLSLSVMSVGLAGAAWAKRRKNKKKA
ncbi:MAG TPA: PEP-CTERM sorting domain-containing protein [Rhizomicrobium sp.]|nr:PEP-CTERM sorting domain-containing protein [Rhizomicrobium sp.]